jgi:hypothetical protein
MSAHEHRQFALKHPTTRSDTTRTKRHETKRNDTTRNETKRHETTRHERLSTEHWSTLVNMVNERWSKFGCAAWDCIWALERLPLFTCEAELAASSGGLSFPAKAFNLAAAHSFQNSQIDSVPSLNCSKLHRVLL